MVRRGHDGHPHYRDCPDENCRRFPCRVYREGYEDGYRRGYDRGHADGEAAGYSAGYSAGHAAGHAEGYAAGPGSLLAQPRQLGAGERP
jgi:hypothetical protein